MKECERSIEKIKQRGFLPAGEISKIVNLPISIIVQNIEPAGYYNSCSFYDISEIKEKYSILKTKVSKNPSIFTFSPVESFLSEDEDEDDWKLNIKYNLDINVNEVLCNLNEREMPSLIKIILSSEIEKDAYYLNQNNLIYKKRELSEKDDFILCSFPKKIEEKEIQNNIDDYENLESSYYDNGHIGFLFPTSQLDEQIHIHLFLKNESNCPLILYAVKYAYDYFPVRASYYKYENTTLKSIETII